MKDKILLYGGTGQSKMMSHTILQKGLRVDSVIDDTENLTPPYDVKHFICGKDAYLRWKEEVTSYKDYSFAITIGNPHGKIRCDLYRKLEDDGLEPLTLITKGALLTSASINIGAQIHEHSIVNPFTKIGKYCILNTKSLVEHDCILGEGVEVGPNATICGEVTIDDYSWVGAGSVILPKLKIGKNVIIGAGSVVTKNIPDNEVWVGNPAKFLKENEIK